MMLVTAIKVSQQQYNTGGITMANKVGVFGGILFVCFGFFFCLVGFFFFAFPDFCPLFPDTEKTQPKNTHLHSAHMF